MKNLTTYAKYIFPLAIIGFVLDFWIFKTEIFRYVGIFIGSILATNIIYKDKKNSP